MDAREKHFLFVELNEKHLFTYCNMLFIHGIVGIFLVSLPTDLDVLPTGCLFVGYWAKQSEPHYWLLNYFFFRLQLLVNTCSHCSLVAAIVTHSESAQRRSRFFFLKESYFNQTVRPYGGHIYFNFWKLLLILNTSRLHSKSKVMDCPHMLGV